MSKWQFLFEGISYECSKYLKMLKVSNLKWVDLDVHLGSGLAEAISFWTYHDFVSRMSF